MVDAMNAPEMQPMQQLLQDMVKTYYGPDKTFYDTNGTPTKEAIALITYLGITD
jgi:hypothetical protein